MRNDNSNGRGGFGFSRPGFLVTILDTAIDWTLAGLAVAKFAPGKR